MPRKGFNRQNMMNQICQYRLISFCISLSFVVHTNNFLCMYQYRIEKLIKLKEDSKIK